MGIEHQDLRAMLRVLKSNHFTPGGKLLILGDAVIHFKFQQLLALMEEVEFKITPVEGELTPYKLGVALGFDCVDTLDINGKATITQDLQQELPNNLLSKYDLVIDAGVLFWCFDPAHALKNIFRLIKPGGKVFHITALSGYFGRGYYSIHPKLFEDFYLSNQCIFLQMSLRTKPQTMFRELFWRIWRRLGIVSVDSEFGVNYIDNLGHSFLGKVTRSNIQFSKSFNYPEADMIPNNIIATYAFQKTSNCALIDPIQKG